MRACIASTVSVILILASVALHAQMGLVNDYKNGGTRFDAEKYKSDRDMQQTRDLQQQHKSNYNSNTSSPSNFDSRPIYKDRDEENRLIRQGMSTPKQRVYPADGPGVDVYNGDKYEGTFKNGIIIGNGKITYANGDVYEGHFETGSPDGNGTYTYADGRVYTGPFISGQKAGWTDGTLVYKDGSKFVGRFMNDERNGSGTEYDANGNITRSGTWEKGIYLKNPRYMPPSPSRKMQPLPVLTIQIPASPKGDNVPKDGMASFQFPNGDLYTGSWEKKKMVSGVYTFKNGDEYHGTFKNNSMNDKGFYKFSNGNAIEANFKNNKPETFKNIYWANGDSMLLFNNNIYDPSQRCGIYYYFTNGDLLRAIYLNGQLVGEVTCWYGNEDMYIGQYKDGMRNDDRGVYIYANHDYLSSGFVNDKPTEKTIRGEGYGPQDKRPYYR